MARDENKIMEQAMKSLLNSEGWKNYLEPWLKRKEEEATKINSINFGKTDAEILSQLKNNNVKAEVYRTVRNRPQFWLDEKVYKEEKHA